MRKYAEYYLSTKKTEHGYIWRIWNKPGGEVLQSSDDGNFQKEDWYFKTKEQAYQEGAEAIQDYY